MRIQVSKISRRKLLASMLLIALSLALLGCNSLPLPLPDSSTPTATITQTITPTLEPTATLTPTPLPPLLLLLLPPEADPALGDYLQTTFAEKAAENGLRWQVRPFITAEEAARDVKYIIAVPPAQGLAELVAGAPDTRFLAVNVPGLEPAPNLIAIGGGTETADQQGFIAGYIAAAITDQWRVGVISVEDSETGQAARVGFQTGVPYFCGLCNPEYAPFYEYPLYIGMTAGAADADWRVAGDYLIDRHVDTVYVEPGAGGEDLLRYLATANINIIGGVIPPEDVRDRWVVSIRPEILQNYLEYWPVLVGDEPGFSLPLPILLTDVNPDLLSPGRLRHAEQIFAEVQAGYIFTGVEAAEAAETPTPAP